MTAPLLELRNVTQRFGGLVAVNDVSVTIGRGEIVGLIGPNGAGKSTLFNMIAGAALPAGGSILFEGEDITTLPATARCARGIARTFQVVKSFETMSVIDNVIVGSLVRTSSVRKARSKALEVLDATGLRGREAVAANELVPSEKRRLEVARALATEPKMLLLDEVLTGLTRTEALQGVELIRSIHASGVTILMVEHVLEVVMPLVERVVMLDLGGVIADGPPRDVVKQERVITAYLGERHRARNA
jgi:branched-chain amino acid transport system ATP-binding protein